MFATGSFYLCLALLSLVAKSTFPWSPGCRQSHMGKAREEEFGTANLQRALWPAAAAGGTRGWNLRWGRDT